MIRIAQKSVTNLLMKNASLSKSQRNYSSSRSLKYKISILLGSSTVVASALTLAYAKYDKKFGDQLSSYLPFIKSFLEDEKVQSKDSFEKSFMRKHSYEPINVTTIESLNDTPNERKNEQIQLNEKNENTLKLKTEPIISPNMPKDELKGEIQDNFEQFVKKEKKYDENEFKSHLKELLYAFNEFYEEKRVLFESDFKDKQDIMMKEEILKEKSHIADQYDKSFNKLKKIENLLEIRDQLDKQEMSVKKLWMLNQILSKMLEHDRSSNQIAPIQIAEKMDCIRKVLEENFSNEPLFSLALQSLNENIYKNGVYSEIDLIERFKKVEKISNKVSLIQNEYTTIFGYAKSFAYSYIRPLYELEFSLSLNPIKIKQIPKEELDGILDVDPTQWDTYDILNRVRYFVQRHNLEMALRYSNLLTGEPRKISQDWIQATRDHLEVKQMLNLLQSKIASINIHQLNFAQ